MKVSLTAFSGMMPKIASHLLPTTAAQSAINARLTSGSLRGINTPALYASTLVASAVSAYVLGPNTGPCVLSWAVDTDVARSPTADSEHRAYYTNGTAPKKTNLSMASSGGGPYPTAEYNMGVATPTATMGITATAGSGSVPLGTYVYCYTFVTQFGSTLLEESAPSPTVTATLTATGNIGLTGIASPAVTTGYNYQYKRIYRTTGTAFQMVAQIALATTSYTDTLAATAIAGDPLLTVGWAPPPTDMKGIVAMPSGTMSGFRDNEIWFSEPGFPHAWPAKYMQALDNPIVAIKAFGNNLAVATQGNPYVGSGLYPDSYTFQKIPRLEPCVSKRSMASDEFGAIYMGKNGLVALGLDGDTMPAATILTRLELADYAPDTFTAAVFEGRYYAFYTNSTKSGTFIFERHPDPNIRLMETAGRAFCIEPTTAQLLYVDALDNKLYSLDPTNGLPLTYSWKSKLINVPQPVNFGYFQVLRREDTAADAALAAATDAANAAIVAANAAAYAAGNLFSALNQSALNTYALNGSALLSPLSSIAPTVGVYIYAGGTLRYSKAVKFNTVYTLPSGFKAIGWEVVLSGQREVASFEMANSVNELRES